MSQVILHDCTYHHPRPVNEELVLLGALVLALSILIGLVGGFVYLYLRLDRR